MQDLWFNKAGTTSRAEQRILKRANSTKPIDPRSIKYDRSQPVLPVMTQPIPQTERYKKEAAAAKDCISQYNVPSCLEKWLMEGWNWKIGGRQGPGPKRNACVDKALEEGMSSFKSKKQIESGLTNKTYDYAVGKPKNLDDYDHTTISKREEGMINAHILPKKQTCDSAYKELKDMYKKQGRDKFSISECLELCMQNKMHEGDTLRMIKDMESSPRYENMIQEYGKEHTDIRIANKKAMLCASKKLTAYLCRTHKKEDTLNTYLPYILGGLVLYVLLKK